jgi:hypothetical protein
MSNEQKNPTEFSQDFAVFPLDYEMEFIATNS